MCVKRCIVLNETLYFFDCPVRHVRQSVLGEVLKSTAPNQFDFTMCNPPFFGSEEETDSNQKSRQPDRSEPSGAKTGTNSELVVAGGELEFVHQMIEDSKLYRSSVKSVQLLLI